MNLTFFRSQAAFRSWLRENHSTCNELWLGIHKKASGMPSVSYPEALDEALCFGWIDGVRKSVDATSYRVRFTPRKARSQWSAVNIARARKLIAATRMQPAGLKAYEAGESMSRTYSYEQRTPAKLSPAEEQQFQASKFACEFFQSQPPWYRRTATWWVISAKREDTRRRRLARLVADSAAARTIPPLTGKPPTARQQKKSGS